MIEAESNINRSAELCKLEDGDMIIIPTGLYYNKTTRNGEYLSKPLIATVKEIDGEKHFILWAFDKGIFYPTETCLSLYSKTNLPIFHYLPEYIQSSFPF